MKIIAVDVDLTVVEMIEPWITWYRDKTGENITSFDNKTWHIEDLMVHHRDPMEFWKNPNLYDDKLPIPYSVHVLTELHNIGYTIIFVSHCMPEHEDSKRYFIKRHFPFHSAFVSTGDKGYVKCDIFIDDSDKYLDKMDKSVISIMHKSLINTTQETHHPKMDWLEILDYIKGIK